MYLPLSLGATNLPAKKPLLFLVHVLTFIEDEVDIRTKEKS